ncbi:MAG: hypothetical protein HQL21_03460 [Candidatus Omnitrophica bacterium]|nr:hypothetical protein [Candidatus Omnitrophota bacterium]
MNLAIACVVSATLASPYFTKEESMKKAVLGLLVGFVIFSGVSFAQTAAPVKLAAVKVQPAPLPGQVEWAALMKKQGEARKALNDQLMVERDAFLAKYPELSARIKAQEKAAKERAEKRKAEKAK